MPRLFAVFLLGSAYLDGAYSSDASAYCPDSPQPMEVYRCQCYRFVSTEMYWPAAQDDCAEKQGQLVQVTDADMSSWLTKQLDRKFYLKNGVWIGLQYKSSANDWTWPAGLNLTAAGYSNWADKEPNRRGLLGIIGNADCAMASRTDGWRWRAKICSLLEWKYYFVCQYPFRDGVPCTENSQLGDLSIEAVIGIVIGAIVGFVLLSLLLCWLLCLLRSTACDRLKARSRLRRPTASRPSISDAATVSRSAGSQAGPVHEAPASEAYEAVEANDLNEQLEGSQQQRRLQLLQPAGASPHGCRKPPELNVAAAGANDVELMPLRQQESVKIKNDGSHCAAGLHAREGSMLGSGDRMARQRHSGGSSCGTASGHLERAVSIEDNVLAANADVPYEKEQFTRSMQHLDKA